MHTERHTPGPWVASWTHTEGGGPKLGWFVAPENEEAAEVDGVIASVNCGSRATDDSDPEANAHLIAAAPELFYTLERILVAHESGNNGLVMGEAGLCKHFEAMAREAIDKARGRS